MGYKLIFSIIIILTLITTAFICVTKPQMHKSVLVYNSDYTITLDEEKKVEQKTIPILEKPIEVKQIETKTENNIEIQNTKFEPKTVQVTQNQQPKVQKIVQTENQPIKIQKTNVQTTKTNVEQPKIDTQKIIANNKKIIDSKNNVSQTQVQQSPTAVSTKNITAPVKTVTTTVKPTQTTTQTPKITTTNTTTVKAPEPKVLTAKEEELAWNIWRSNLTNKLMKDTNLPSVPMGTEFYIEFRVDKYGKVSQLKAHTVPEKYTPYAVQYVLPVVRSYQGRSILNFPEGSQRISTIVNIAWRISNRSSYSTPQDYYDIEKIKK